MAGGTAIAVTALAWVVVAAGSPDVAIHCDSPPREKDLAAAVRNLRAAETHAQKVAFGGSLFHAAKIGPIPGPAYESAQADADESLRLAKARLREARLVCTPLAGDGASPQDPR